MKRTTLVTNVRVLFSAGDNVTYQLTPRIDSGVAATTHESTQSHETVEKTRNRLRKRCFGASSDRSNASLSKGPSAHLTACNSAQSDRRRQIQIDGFALDGLAPKRDHRGRTNSDI